MKFTFTTNKTILKAVLIMALAMLFGVCYWVIVQPARTLRQDASSSFPGVVWPQGNIKIKCYYTGRVMCSNSSRGIGISINGIRMLDIEFPQKIEDLKFYSEKEFSHPLESRIYLYVDGKLVSDLSKQVRKSGLVVWNFKPNSPELSATYDINWTPLLSIGEHNAKIVLTTLSEKTIEHEWRFTITW